MSNQDKKLVFVKHLKTDYPLWVLKKKDENDYHLVHHAEYATKFTDEQEIDEVKQLLVIDWEIIEVISEKDLEERS